MLKAHREKKTGVLIALLLIAVSACGAPVKLPAPTAIPTPVPGTPAPTPIPRVLLPVRGIRKQGQ